MGLLVKFQLIELSRSPSAAYNRFHCTGTPKSTRAPPSLDYSPGSETINVTVMWHHVKAAEKQWIIIQIREVLDHRFILYTR